MKPRARLIRLIGEELISDEPVALVELVKNAYDADATQVEIEFEFDGENQVRCITISDNGIGMSLDTVLSSWLEPGTIAKRKGDRSAGGRLYQGAKGIGRFATARLGSTLLMETKTAHSNTVTSVLLDWGKFDDESYLEDISVEFETYSNKHFPTGTKLTVEGTDETAWDEDAFNELHSRLSRLISPFSEISDFDINLKLPSIPDLSGTIEPPIFLSDPHYMFRGNVDQEGNIKGHIYFSEPGTKKTSKKLKTKKASADQPQLLCGEFNFEIRAWDRETDSLRPLAEQSHRSVAVIRKELSRFSGVSIYRDGFRVHPYGEAGDDWLRLDLRSRQNPTRNLANNQIVSAIEISRDNNPDLQDRSTREGMVKNNAHRDLENRFTEVLTLLEEERYQVRPRKSVDQRAEPLFEAFDLKQTTSEVQRSLGSDHPLSKLLTNKEKEVSDGVDRVQEMMSRLLLSAGLGHMVDIVIHELGGPLGKIDREVDKIQTTLKKDLVESKWNQYEPRFTSVKAWLAQLYNLRQRLDPQTAGKRGRATSFSVQDEIQSCMDLYQTLHERQNITVNKKGLKAPLQVKMSRAVLSQVIQNLLDNAIYWVSQKHGKSGAGKIEITLKKTKAGFDITVSDNGLGIDDSDKEIIFEPYYSKKPNGAGLGLHIARLVIEPYGRLTLASVAELNGSTFEAKFEKGVGR